MDFGEMVDERDPIAVARLELVPETAHDVTTGEVGEQGRLAKPGLGHDERQPVIDVAAKSVQEPSACKGLGAHGSRLDLAANDGGEECVAFAGPSRFWGRPVGACR